MTNYILLKLYVYCRRSIYFILWLIDALTSANRNSIVVLSYHSVSQDNWRYSIDPDVIKKQIDYLLKYYDFASLNDLSKYLKGLKKFSKPTVILTFDDGYRDILTLKPYLDKNKIKPALFVLSDTKNANKSEMDTDRQFLNDNEIRLIIKSGWEIGNHTSTHSNLSNLKKDSQKKEIIESKKTLENKFGIKVDYFAYPRGKYSKSSLEYVKKAKYELCLSMDDSIIISSTNPYLIPRVGVDRTHNLMEFKTLFSRSNIRFRQLIKMTLIGKYL